MSAARAAAPSAAALSAWVVHGTAEHREVPVEGRQRVVELVRHAPGEATDRRMAAVAFGLQFLDVDGDADDGPFRVG
jgi:hypothetical protein